MYLSLHTAEPNEADLEATEVVYPGYERQSLEGVRFIYMNGRFQNTDNIQFAESLDEGPGVTHFAVVDTPNGPGAMYSKSALDEPYKVRKKWAFAFSTGALNVFPNQT